MNNFTCILTILFFLTLLLVSATLLVKSEYDKQFLSQSNTALLNEVESLRNALTIKFPELDATLPTLVLHIEVSDGQIGEWALVSITSHKLRDDCPAVTTRHIMDLYKVEHQITEATRGMHESIPAQDFVSVQFQVKIPETVPAGDSFYQSRTKYTCSDGSEFLIETPWAPFKIS